MDIAIDLALLVGGFVMLVKGADLFVGGASGIAARFGIPPLVIGLTIVAMGTSAPEMAVSISAALKGSADIAVGNALGSNIMNILVILGAAAAIRAIPVARSTVRIEIPFTIVITFLLLLLGRDGSLGTVDALVLLACFALFLAYLYRMARRGKANADDVPSTDRPIAVVVVITAVGLALVVLGGSVTVDAATSLALAAGVSERVVGLTVVAFGTSLPELVTTVTASRKGKSDIAIGNIVGSNIFNILFVLGVSSLVTTVPFDASFFDDAVISAAAAAVLWLCCAFDLRLSRREGAVLLACYGAYFWYMI